MIKKSQSCTAKAGGYFVTSFVHAKTGKRIYAWKYGKRAFFIPDDADSERQERGKK